MMTTPDLIDSATDFVAEAERMTNERDVDGVHAVFSHDAHQIATLDGLLIEARGIDEIHRAWGTMCAFMEARRMFVSKTLVAADANTIVNEWVGEVAGKHSARGIEVWEFNEAGLVVEQRLYGFLDARPDSSVVQNLRMLVAHPLTAIGYTLARRGA